jgi:ferredoxin--NADP+ reductase
VRYRHDAGYVTVHTRLQQQYPNYRYVLLTTREPENLDPGADGYVGKQYLQDLFSTGRLADTIGWQPRPEDTHAYVCGNPAMIGLPARDREGRLVFPEPSGLVEVLSHQGFQLDEPRRPGNIHVERYW